MIFMSQKNGSQRAGLAAGLEFIAVSDPQPLMNKDIKVKDNNQSPKMLVLPTTEADSELSRPKISCLV